MTGNGVWLSRLLLIILITREAGSTRHRGGSWTVSLRGTKRCLVGCLVQMWIFCCANSPGQSGAWVVPGHARYPLLLICLLDLGVLFGPQNELNMTPAQAQRLTSDSQSIK